MRPVFVRTLSNVQTFLAQFEAMKNRGASEACIMTLVGEVGWGKTKTITWWAAQGGAIMLRAKQNWTPTRFLVDVLGALGKEPEGRNLVAQVIQELGRYQVSMQADGKIASLCIDEADSILDYPKGKLLETIRDITDTTEILTVLVGMNRLVNGITRYPAIARRVSQPVVFKPLTNTDVAAMVTAICEVDVKDDLVAALAKAARGYASEVLEGIAAIERFGRRNPGTVGCAEMAGEILLYSHATGKPFKVEASHADVA